MSGRINIYDSCYIKTLYNKKKGYFKGMILSFQLEELTQNELNYFYSKGGSVLQIKDTHKHKDNHFLDLDKRLFTIYTYDKKLIRQLSSKGFLTHYYNY